MTRSRRLLAAALPALVAISIAAGTAADILPYDQVRAGMIATGRTVLHGEEPETFEAEILGKLDRIGPGQNLILARLSGPGLAATGVLEGMSGSPVYVEGRLIGAIAYSWGFSREPIAGITPIEEMLAIPASGSVGPGGKAALDRAGPRRAPFRASRPDRRGAASRILPEFLAPARAASRMDETLLRLFGAARGSDPPPAGLVLGVNGLPAEWLSRRLPAGPSAPVLRISGAGRATGLSTSEPGGAAAAGSPRRLEAGDAVGAQLVRGDVMMTAFGTVTRVEGDRVLAFGHPFLQIGTVAYPMTRARVEALLPSLASSFKIASPTETVGVFDQDRTAGLAGRLGQKPPLVPVRLEVLARGAPPRSFGFEVVDDPLLTPVLLYLTLGGILEATQKGPGDATVELREGSVLLLDDERRADLSNLFSGPEAILEASAMVGLVAEALLRNDHEPVRLRGVNLIVGYADGLKTAAITGAWADRRQVRPGETLTLSVGLLPYREGEGLESVAIEVPRELQPGRLTFHVGDARTVTRIEHAGTDGFLPLDLDDLLDFINSLRRNQSLTILATRDEPSVLIGSEPLPNLPPSRAALILSGENRASVPVLRLRPVLDETRDTDYAIEGYRRVEVEVIR